MDKQRTISTTFDIVVGGNRRDDAWEKARELARSLAEAGATWWGEYIPLDTGDLDTVRACISRGPLRID